MSVKIYNGFIFKNYSKLDQVINFVNKIRPAFNKIADNIWMDIICNFAINEYDRDCLKEQPLKREASYIHEAISWINEIEHQSDKTNERSITNVDFDLAFYPIKLNNKNRIIGIFITNNRLMENAFLQLPEISEFCYYNNSDQPEDVSDDEWKQRENIWLNTVFKDNLVVAETMPVITLVKSGYRFLSFDKIEKYYHDSLHNFNDRVQFHTKEVMWKRFMSHSAPLDDSSVYSKYRDFQKTEEYLKIFEFEKKKIENILKNTIDFNDLSKEP